MSTTTSKRIWKSAVARTLVQRHRQQPLPDSRVERMIAQGQKGISPAKCAALLAKKLRDSKTSEAPGEKVDLAAVCTRIGLSVHYRPLGLDGLLQETDSGFQAIIDSTARESRQRMTLAHEIGHLMLYQTTGLRQAFGHVSPDQRSGIESTEIEELCDHFASELTMPCDCWEELISAEGVSLITLMKLKNSFGVSLASAARRMIEIGPLECAIIVWSPVYDNEILTRLDPVRSWVGLGLGLRELSQGIERSAESLRPGSPFYAFEKRSISAGRISLSLNGIRGRYLAHSDLIDSNHAISLLVPEHFRSDVMRRGDTAEQHLVSGKTPRQVYY